MHLAIKKITYLAFLHFFFFLCMRMYGYKYTSCQGSTGITLFLYLLSFFKNMFSRSYSLWCGVNEWLLECVFSSPCGIPVLNTLWLYGCTYWYTGNQWLSERWPEVDFSMCSSSCLPSIGISTGFFLTSLKISQTIILLKIFQYSYWIQGALRESKNLFFKQIELKFWP